MEIPLRIREANKFLCIAIRGTRRILKESDIRFFDNKQVQFTYFSSQTVLEISDKYVLHVLEIIIKLQSRLLIPI